MYKWILREKTGKIGRTGVLGFRPAILNKERTDE
jgi:hypothetical protein